MASQACVVGITNARLNAAKRGVAVAISARLAAATVEPICVLGADPADRDVERRLPQLVATWGEPARMEVTRGPHHVDVTNFEAVHVCVVSVSDRESIELVLPALLERFSYVIIDAPSRAGSGVGISDVLFGWLDALVVATGLRAGELAETRRYLEQVAESVDARHLAPRVVTIGDPGGSGLSHHQLESRLATLPTVAHLPRPAGHSPVAAPDDPHLDDAFRPIIRWIVERAFGRTHSPARNADASAASEHHVANELYRATMTYRGSLYPVNEE